MLASSIQMGPLVATPWSTAACIGLLGLCGCGIVSLADGGGGDDGEQGGQAGEYIVVFDPDEPLRPDNCPHREVTSAPLALARNIIVIVGDGMGPEQLAAGRLLVGGTLRMDRLAAHTRLNTDSWSTLNVDGAPVTDSAAAATAFTAGVLARNGHLGLSADGAELTTILDLAQQNGYATGLVTTSYLFDATPMAFAVHIDNRALYDEVIAQLVGRTRIDLVLGGAGGLLDDAYEPWRLRAQEAGYDIVYDAVELAAHGDPSRSVLGLFVGQLTDPPTELLWWTTPAYRRGNGETDPSLPEMTTWALDRLGSAADGLLLLVEDEHIDELGHISGSHAATAMASIAQEVAYLDRAVGSAIDWVEANSSFEETLLIVLADHETGGYSHDPGDPTAGTFSTTGHTREAVDLFASGPGSTDLARLCRLTDVFALLTGRSGEL